MQVLQCLCRWLELDKDPWRSYRLDACLLQSSLFLCSFSVKIVLLESTITSKQEESHFVCLDALSDPSVPACADTNFGWFHSCSGGQLLSPSLTCDGMVIGKKKQRLFSSLWGVLFFQICFTHEDWTSWYEWFYHLHGQLCQPCCVDSCLTARHVLSFKVAFQDAGWIAGERKDRPDQKASGFLQGLDLLHVQHKCPAYMRGG